jgi:hypothetical protein
VGTSVAKIGDHLGHPRIPCHGQGQRLEPDVTWLSFLVGAATLWLTFRIPGLMRAGAGGNIADMLAKALMLRFALRIGS